MRPGGITLIVTVGPVCMTRTLTPLLGMWFWRSEGKCGHGKNSENSHELHDDGDLTNQALL